MEKKQYKQKIENLHQFQSEIFLGFTSNQPALINEYQSSFVCGRPLWLKKPNQRLLKCDNCHNQNLTFLCQIFCPLNADHCYNRILYLLYCQKCRRCFKCLKQQTSSAWKPTEQLQNLKCGVKIIQQKAYQIQSQTYSKKQLLKILNKSKLQVQEQAIIQQAFDQDDQDQVQVQEQLKEQKQKQQLNDLADLQIEKINQQHLKSNKIAQNQNIQDIQGQSKRNQQQQFVQKQIQNIKINDIYEHNQQKNKANQQKRTDLIFEQYKKTMKILSNPIMLYSNVPVSYNSFSLNPKHFCKHCESKLQMELQLTQQLLLINKNLVALDWGSIMIYTCTASCEKSEQQCVVVQYEVDAISQQQIKKLKKKKKNKKKNHSKSKSKSKSNQKQKQEKNQKIQLKEEIKKKQSSPKNQEGDWD